MKNKISYHTNDEQRENCDDLEFICRIVVDVNISVEERNLIYFARMHN